MTLPVFEPPSLDDLKLLYAVVERGSFSAAAHAVGTTQPRVSRAITRLEERLGVALVRRSPRGVAVTPEGERYAAHARHALVELQTIETEIAGSDAAVRPLRVSAPPSITRRVLLPHFTTFCRAHPEVRLELVLDARRVDLIEEHVDVAIRLGPLQPTWRRARRILAGHLHVYAAPSLGLGPLRGPEAVADLAALVLNATHLRDRWPFKWDGELVLTRVSPKLYSNDVDALLGFTLAGLGVTMLPDFLVTEQEARGSLVRLTDEAQTDTVEVFAVTTSPPERAVRLVEHLADALGTLRPGASTT